MRSVFVSLMRCQGWKGCAWCSCMQDTGLDMNLSNATAVATVFVPINAAFDAAAASLNSTLDVLLSQKPLLTSVSACFQIFHLCGSSSSHHHGSFFRIYPSCACMRMSAPVWATHCWKGSCLHWFRLPFIKGCSLSLSPQS